MHRSRASFSFRVQATSQSGRNYDILSFHCLAARALINGRRTSRDPPRGTSHATKLRSSSSLASQSPPARVYDWFSLGLVRAASAEFIRPLWPVIAIFIGQARAKTMESTPRKGGQTLTSSAHVSHWSSIVFGLPAFHKFVSSIVWPVNAAVPWKI